MNSDRLDRLDKPVYLRCNCATPYHFLLIEPDPDDRGMLNVSFVSTRNGSLWRRVKYAIKHVFGRDDLVFADLVIDRRDFENTVTDEGQRP